MAQIIMFLPKLMPNISLMAVKRFFTTIILAWLLASCAVINSPQVTKIVLLSSFEGRYREIGYDALYAARLAISDSERDDLTLLAIDDGGTIETAIARAKAIALDNTIEVVIVLGIYATDSHVLDALDKSTIIAGHWGASSHEQVIMLANPHIDAQIATSSPNGSEIFALKQTPLTQDNVADMTIWSSASYPNDSFTERYMTSDLFVPYPAIYTTLVYDATSIAIEHIRTGIVLHNIEYNGINGAFTFDTTGYWVNAPLYKYSYNADGQLVLIQ